MAERRGGVNVKGVATLPRRPSKGASLSRALCRPAQLGRRGGAEEALRGGGAGGVGVLAVGVAADVAVGAERLRKRGDKMGRIFLRLEEFPH